MIPPSTNTLGRYELLREIARSNDIVYEGFDPLLKRKVAVKELYFAPNLAGQQRRERIERFYREAKAAGALQHPGIVTIHEVSEDKGRHFIAMEYLEGQNLRDILQMKGALPVPEVIEITSQICDALQYAHERAVIHRDIKPDNVQVLPDRRVKLTDFGIARITSEPSITAEGQVFGTPSYMSPEQVVGRGIDRRSDIFSLGIVLYEMLTGRKPFVGDSVVTITYNIMHQEIEPPPGIPPHLNNVIRHALAKDPDRRYSSASEMKSDLIRPAMMIPHLFHPPVPTASGSVSTSLAADIPVAQADPVVADNLLAHLPPGALDPPEDGPAAPLIKPKTAVYMKILVAILLIGGILGAFVWGLNQAYSRYQMTVSLAGAADAFNEGKRLYMLGEFHEAVSSFEDAARLAPNEEVRLKASQMISNCYTRIGQGYDQQGMWEQAVEAYQMALRYYPNNAVAYYQLGNVYEKLQRPGDAGDAWNRALQLDARGDAGREARHALAATYYNQGVELFNQGRYADARQSWLKAIEAAPESDVAVMAEQQLNMLNRGAQ